MVSIAWPMVVVVVVAVEAAEQGLQLQTAVENKVAPGNACVWSQCGVRGRVCCRTVHRGFLDIPGGDKGVRLRWQRPR